MVYGTYSTGFRPGGNNRLPTASPFSADTLDNFEIGWKTSWLERRMRFNGAVFYDKWKNAQTAVQGQYGITSIVNAGDAKSTGVETEFNWLVTEHLNLYAAGTVLFKDETTTVFCEPTSLGVPQSSCSANAVDAAPGTQMPGIPRNKADATARYQFEAGSYRNFLQASMVYQSGTTYSLEATRFFAGDTPAFSTVDLSAGTGTGNWTIEAYIDNLFDKRGELGKNSECNDLAAHYCLLNAHIYPIKPMQFGVKFAQRF